MMQERTIESVEGCPTWVRDHPSLQPWEQGRRTIKNRLNSWRQQYRPTVCDDAVGDDQENDVALRRQLNCWVYHWRTAGEKTDGLEVAESVENGVGFKGNGDLGGNPFFDLMLAVAIIGRHNKAIARFQEEYFEEAKSHAAKCNSVFVREDPMEWWTLFFDDLGGFSGRPAKLDVFDGRAAIRRWLPIVLWNFLRNLLRKRGRRNAREGELMDETSGPEGVEFPMEQREHVETLAAVFRSAYEQLSAADASLLSMYYDEALPNLEVASLLGIAPGTATRRRQKVVKQFRELLQKEAERRDESILSLGERIGAAGSDFASILFRMLEDRDEKEES